MLSVHANIITLDETIFYAFSGGQESDHSTIRLKHVNPSKGKERIEIYVT